VDLSPERSC